jgi:succinate dehydrogenase/fumarate reductase flavoprotein subunit
VGSTAPSGPTSLSFDSWNDLRLRSISARMVATGALARTESRGGHYRRDFPDRDPAWQRRTFMTLAEAKRGEQRFVTQGRER